MALELILLKFGYLTSKSDAPISKEMDFTFLGADHEL